MAAIWHLKFRRIFELRNKISLDIIKERENPKHYYLGQNYFFIGTVVMCGVCLMLQRHGPRLKCAACRIVAHSGCISILLDRQNFTCKPTFRDVGVRQYREQTTIQHHWVHRRSQKGKCRQCGKVSASPQLILPFFGQRRKAVCNLQRIVLVEEKSWVKNFCSFVVEGARGARIII